MRHRYSLLSVRACSAVVVVGGCKIPVLDKEKALPTLVLLSAMKPKKRKRSCWSKEWLKKREEYSHMTLLKELKENNPNDFRNYLIITVCYETIIINRLEIDACSNTNTLEKLTFNYKDMPITFINSDLLVQVLSHLSHYRPHT